ncbi:hypothetical protein CIG19_19805 [Enterobacterales bacterium CwR94]|nr:hypothetical protein CIG19_19805 [Enterobacterales bacterium CwR94]
MKKMTGLLALLLAAASLAGCGLKGPLYFPPKDNSQQTQPAPPPPANASDDVSQAPSATPSGLSSTR